MKSVYLYVSVMWAASNLAATSLQAQTPEDPFVMAALGDSITTALNAKRFWNNKDYSWATGQSDIVDSHFERLGRIYGENANMAAYNMAGVGSTVYNLPKQYRKLLNHIGSEPVDYMTVMVGGNDICGWNPNYEEELLAFKDGLRQVVATAVDRDPGVKVLLVPIPDMVRLYEVGVEKQCQSRWNLYPFCNPLLKAETPAERQQFGVRNRAANAAIEDVAQEFSGNVRYAAGVATQYFEAEHVSSLDCFHPSVEGQKLISDISWQEGWFAQFHHLELTASAPAVIEMP